MSTKDINATEPKPTTKKKSAPKTEKKKSAEPKNNAKPKQLCGLVANCGRLNVRSTPIMTSGVVAILNKGDSVLIDPEQGTDGWHKVKTKNGKTGFCMKKYIKVL